VKHEQSVVLLVVEYQMFS